MGNGEMPESRTELAEDRTDYAEDRTLLANERTFGGWVRTSFAAIAVGLGFHVLFRTVEPTWVPKSIATLFILLGTILTVLAERRASTINERLRAHSVRTLAVMNLRLITLAICIGAIALVMALWILA